MIGDRIRKIRESQNLSQNELALRMGISRPTLSKIETNKKGVDDKLLMVAAKALNLDYRVLVAGESVLMDALLSESAERINQATERIIEETHAIENATKEIELSRLEKKLQIIKVALIVLFLCAIIIETVMLVLYFVQHL